MAMATTLPPIRSKSRIVQALADIASKGQYTVNPAGARHMNEVFVAVAALINDLEAEENNSE